MDATPDYSKYSLADLQDVEKRIDQSLYPERHQMVLQQIERKQAEPVVLAPLSPSEKRRTAAISRAVAAIEIAAGLIGIGTVLWLWLASVAHSIIPLTLPLYALIPSLSIVAGVLLWRDHPIGLPLSIGLQALTAPIIKISSFVYSLSAGINVTTSHGWNHADGSRALELGMNWVSVALLTILLVQHKYLSQHGRSGYDSSLNFTWKVDGLLHHAPLENVYETEKL